MLESANTVICVSSLERVPAAQTDWTTKKESRKQKEDREQMGTVRVRPWMYETILGAKPNPTLQRRVQPTSQLLKWLMLQTMACGILWHDDVAICWPLAQLARLNTINNILGYCMQAPGLCCN